MNEKGEQFLFSDIYGKENETCRTIMMQKTHRATVMKFHLMRKL